jgi:hypothetical protein
MAISSVASIGLGCVPVDRVLFSHILSSLIVDKYIIANALIQG